jgi:DNA-binding protein HU-beta
MALPMLTAAATAAELARRTGITQVDVRHVLDELKNLTVDELTNGNRFRVVGLVQLEPKIRPARAARMGRNPRTGEDVQIEAKPADVVVRARVLKDAQQAHPSLGKLSKALGVPKPSTKVPPKSEAVREAPVKPQKKKLRAKAKSKH